MNLKTKANFDFWLDEVEENSTNSYQTRIVTEYRTYLARHNGHFTLEMYRKLKQIVTQIRNLV